MSTPPRTREDRSPASRTDQPGDRQTNNDALAANLATSLPKGTSSRAYANSAKKRRQAPNLSRTHPSPSREERVSTLFQSIAPTLTLSNTRKLRRPLAETRHTRFGEYDADHVREPYSYRTPPKGDHSSEAAPDPEASRESSGKGVESGAKPRPLRRLLSPSAWHAADSSNVDASLEPALRELSTAAEQEHRSEPDESYKENVKAWLHGTQHLPSDPEPESTAPSSSSSSLTEITPITYPKLSTAQFPANPPPKGSRSSSSSSSDKENIPPNPSTTPPSPSPCPPQLTLLPTSTAPSHFRNPSTSPNPKPILHLCPPKRTGLPLPPPSSPPKGYFATPPRRRNRANAIIPGDITSFTPSSRLPFSIFEDGTGEAEGGRAVAAPTTSPLPPTFTAPDLKPVVATAGASDHGPGDFTIARDEDVMMDALAGLSPSVEIKRRGRKREGDGKGRARCASYWDGDVLDVPGEKGGKEDGEKGAEGEGEGEGK